MRIHFPATDLPRSQAKRLRRELARLDIAIRTTEAQNLIARMHGYRDWPELCRFVGTADASPGDEPVLREALRKQRLAVLLELVELPAASLVLQRLFDRDAGLEVIWRPLGEDCITQEAGWNIVVAPCRPSELDTRLGYTVVGMPIEPWNGTAPLSVYCGGYATREEAKRVAEWLVLARRAELERRRMPAPGSEELAGATPWGPAERWRCFGEGLIEALVAGEKIYRLDGRLVDGLPAWLRAEKDAEGCGWYSRRQRPLLAHALPRFFLPIEHKVSEYEIMRDFNDARAMFAGKLPEAEARARVMRYAPPQKDPGPVFPWILGASPPRRRGLEPADGAREIGAR